MNCSGCLYWREMDSGQGQCRVNAPVCVILPMQESTPVYGIAGSKSFAVRNEPQVVTAWPVTKSEEWCGEWEAKELNKAS